MRNAYLDNLKLVLILLVVFGHFLESMLQASETIRDLYRLIYVFHVPALVFLAGITSKPSVSKEQIIGLLLVYSAFQISYVALFAKFDAYSLITPYWLLWFIISLLSWKLMLPLFIRLKHAVAISILISVIAGLTPAGYAFSLSRTLVFLPFFLAGQLYGNAILNWFSQALAYRQKALVFAIGTTLMYMAMHYIGDVKWLYGSKSYAALHSEAAIAIGMRLLHLAAASAGIAMLCVLIPKKQTLLSARGGGILPVYLLHGFIILTTRTMVADFAAQQPIIAVLIALPGAMALVWAFSAQPARRAVDLLYKPNFLRPKR